MSIVLLIFRCQVASCGFQSSRRPTSAITPHKRKTKSASTSLATSSGRLLFVVALGTLDLSRLYYVSRRHPSKRKRFYLCVRQEFLYCARFPRSEFMIELIEDHD